MRFHALIIRIAGPKVKGWTQLATILLTMVAACPGRNWAAFEIDMGCPEASGMGGAGVAFRGSVWSVARNPALFQATGLRAGISWCQAFGLPELGRETFLVQAAVHDVPFALQGSSFGTDLYRETELGFTVGRRLHRALAAGAEVRGQRLQIQNYRSGEALAITAGVVVEPTDDIALGAVWRNLNSPRVRGYRDRVASSLTAGAAARLGSDALIAADVVHEPRQRAEYRLGAEARALQSVALRLGLRAEPVRPSVGIGVGVGAWQFDYATDLHPDLGASHQLGLALRFR